jgi:hypothetical protein
MAVFAVKADYLYWMVTSDPGEHQNFVGQSIEFNDWTNAKLFVDGNSFDTPSAEIATMTKTKADNLRDNGLYAYADLTGSNYSTDSTFLIELWAGESYLGYAQGTYAQLAQYIFTPDTIAPAVGGWMPDAYAVPEPTSGLLFLIGGMLLGLKRRRQQV